MVTIFQQSVENFVEKIVTKFHLLYLVKSFAETALKVLKVCNRFVTFFHRANGGKWLQSFNSVLKTLLKVCNRFVTKFHHYIIHHTRFSALKCKGAVTCDLQMFLQNLRPVRPAPPQIFLQILPLKSLCII